VTVIGAGSRGPVTPEIPTSSNPEHTFTLRKLRLCLPEAKTVQKPTAWQTKTTQKVAYRIFSPAHFTAGHHDELHQLAQLIPLIFTEYFDVDRD
jgi:hypothetical protein